MKRYCFVAISLISVVVLFFFIKYIFYRLRYVFSLLPLPSPPTSPLSPQPNARRRTTSKRCVQPSTPRSRPPTSCAWTARPSVRSLGCVRSRTDCATEAAPTNRPDLPPRTTEPNSSSTTTPALMIPTYISTFGVSREF